MQLKNDESRYGVVAQLFHWTIVVLIIVQFILANRAANLPLGVAKIAVLAQHKSFGITILGLALLRLIWRWMNPVPAEPLGIPQSFGGPTCGFFAVAEPLMRRMPGRIVGQTVDRSGKRGFVLTLQAREQHIRREKATSNICSNQALLALCAAVYLSVMGKQGIQEAALLNARKAHFAASATASIPGYSVPMAAPFFNEFVLRLPDKLSYAALSEKLLSDGILAGYDLEQSYPELAGHMLLAVTEKRTRADIDRLLARLEEYA